MGCWISHSKRSARLPCCFPWRPFANGGLIAWDLLSGDTIRLEPFLDAKGAGLRVSGQGLQAIARRAAEKSRSGRLKR